MPTAASLLEVRFPGFELHAGQRAFVISRKPENAYVGGVGAGKSVALIVRACLLGHQFPGNKILLARKSYRELNDTTRATFLEIIPPQLIAGEEKSKDLTHIHARDGGRSTIYWRSYEDSPQDWQKFRSMDFGFIGIDEASECPSGVVDILATRLRTRNIPYRSMNFVSNPVPKDHWIYQQFVEAQDPERALFHGTSYENRANLPPGYIERLERRLTPEKARILLGGEFGHIPDGLPVFENFMPASGAFPWHVQEDLDPRKGLPIIRGWDFGIVRPAVVWLQWMEQRRILREHMGHNISTREYARYIRDISAEMFPGFQFVDYCDPQGFARDVGSGTAPAHELRVAGIHCHRIPKTKPGYRAGLIDDDLVRTVTTEKGVEPAFVIARAHCPILIGGLAGGYRRPEVIPDQPIYDEPVEDGYYEHPMDALGFVYVGRRGAGGSGKHTEGKARQSAKRRASSYGT